MPNENTFFFQADFPGWKSTLTREVTSATSPWEFIEWLSQTTKEIDGLIESSLAAWIDITPINEALKEAPHSSETRNFGQTLAFLNTRKFSQLVNTVSSIEGLQKKEQGELGQFIRLYATRKILSNYHVHLNYAAHFSEIKKFEEGKIQLIANYSGWQCVKKYVVTSQTQPRTFMEFLGSFSVSMEKKLESYLRETADIKKLDSFIANAPKGKTANDLEKLSQFYASDETKNTIREIALASTAKEKGKIESTLYVYTARKLLEPCKLFCLYSQVEIPGLKRLLKKK
ncbi:MAG: hypothetical protein V1776_03245 [Candidatus Diapherotrites archaeon]